MKLWMLQRVEQRRNAGDPPRGFVALAWIVGPPHEEVAGSGCHLGPASTITSCHWLLHAHVTSVLLIPNKFCASLILSLLSTWVASGRGSTTDGGLLQRQHVQ